MSNLASFLDNYSPFDGENEDMPPLKRQERISNNKMEKELTAEEIEELERKLDLLEHNINTQEGDLQTRSVNFEPQPNWPSFYPVVYFEINDVTDELKPYVHEAFFCWCVMAKTFCLKLI